MKYVELSHLLWLEKEIQVLSNQQSYLHKENWQIGKKKNKHPLSDKVVQASKKYAETGSAEDKTQLDELINELN